MCPPHYVSALEGILLGKGEELHSGRTRNSQAFAVRRRRSNVLQLRKTKPQLDSSVNHYMGKITHSLISLLVLKKNLIYEHGDLIQSLKMSVKGFAELCGAGICVQALLCFCLGHRTYLSIYINIIVICSTLK